jgi:hypothetical protein
MKNFLFHIFRKLNYNSFLFPKQNFILYGFRREVTYIFNLNEPSEVIEYHLQQIQQDIDFKAKRKK